MSRTGECVEALRGVWLMTASTRFAAPGDGWCARKLRRFSEPDVDTRAERELEILGAGDVTAVLERERPNKRRADSAFSSGGEAFDARLALRSLYLLVDMAGWARVATSRVWCGCFGWQWVWQSVTCCTSYKGAGPIRGLAIMMRLGSNSNVAFPRHVQLHTWAYCTARRLFSRAYRAVRCR